jgi:tetratricopeptide (TPR) repeat protein
MNTRTSNDRTRECVFVAALVSISAISCAVAMAQEPRQKDVEAESKPPWRRVLRGDDAGRAEALQKSIDDLQRKGRFAEALAPAREALALRLRVQGEDHWETVNARIEVQTCAQAAGLRPEDQAALAAALRQNDEAMRLAQMERHAEAESFNRQALASRQRTLGVDHPITAWSHNNLAFSLDGQKKFAEAEPHYRKALEIRRGTLGVDHPTTAWSYDNLAANLNEQGRYAEAEPLIRKSLEIRRLRLGDDHPLTAQTCNSLAWNLYLRGELAEAETTAIAASRSYEAARLRFSFTGLGRAEFVGDT